MTDPEPGRRGRRAIWSAQLLLVLAGAGLWAASRLTWVVIRVDDGLGPSRSVTLSGAVWAAALLPLAMVVLAAAIAAVAVRGWPLRALAVLLGLAGLAEGYLAVSLWVVHDVTLRAAELAEVPGPSSPAARHFVGAAITLAAAVGTALAAALLMRSAASGGRVAKYAAPGSRRAATPRTNADAPTAMSERVMWDALDEGRDPTDRPAEPAPSGDTEGR